MEFEAVDEGKIGKILVPEGSEGVKVNAPIAILLDEGEKADAVVSISAAMKDIKAAVAAEAPKAEAPKSAAAAPAAKADGARIFASPLAKRIAADKGVELSGVTGTGPRGRIVKSDVENAPGAGHQTTSGAAKPAAGVPAAAGGIPGVAPLPDARLLYPAGSYEETPHDSMRKAIAKRLTSAKTLIPHYYLTVDCNLDALMAVREKMNAAAPKGKDKVPAYKLSVNDFIMKASAMALMKHPDVNASWTDTAILRHKDADVGVAVALDFGLITPIIFKAQTKGLVEISNEVKTLAGLAKEKKLKPNQYEGGGFSVSNLGMYGIKNFTSIINPPQSCIIAVGAGEERAIVKNGKVEVGTVMTVTMSADHRVVDGGTGAKFLQTLKQFIEEPASMLL
jgi:pyruvate dehydrogenase E2 component (dihydrolipoamide acetyltransferase)